MNADFCHGWNVISSQSRTRSFLRCGQRKLARQYPDLPLEWAALNLDLPWSNQGINPGEFDMVYAVNVMHISRDLLFSLNEARSALASDGWLVIGECLRPYLQSTNLSRADVSDS